MVRCRTFRYPRRTRIRTLEIYHRAGGDVAALEIIAMLGQEGYGTVGRNAVERWLREDPARRATQVAALGQRLRHEAAAANGDPDTAKRILASARQMADLLAVTASRASKELPLMKLRNVDDAARLAACLRDLSAATIEGFRAVEILREATINAAHAPPAD